MELSDLQVLAVVNAVLTSINLAVIGVALILARKASRAMRELRQLQSTRGGP